MNTVFNTVLNATQRRVSLFLTKEAQLLTVQFKGLSPVPHLYMMIDREMVWNEPRMIEMCATGEDMLGLNEGEERKYIATAVYNNVDFWHFFEIIKTNQ